MYQPLYVAATGLSAMQEEILTITNNLANAETVAFKKGNTQMESLFFVEKSFKDMLQKEISATEIPPINVEYGTGVKVSSTEKDFKQGVITTTSNSTDMSIQGDGFFQVKMPDESIAYTRAGNFHIDNEGNLADPNGRLLTDNIVIPSNTTSMIVRQDGTVLVAINNETTLRDIGQITLARFTNPEGLNSIGQNLYVATNASGEALAGIAGQNGLGSINQFSLEQSNVDVISEMMKMTITQRVFDTLTKAVQSYDAMLTSLERMKQ